MSVFRCWHRTCERYATMHHTIARYTPLIQCHYCSTGSIFTWRQCPAGNHSCVLRSGIRVASSRPRGRSSVGALGVLRQGGPHTAGCHRHQEHYRCRWWRRRRRRELCVLMYFIGSTRISRWYPIPRGNGEVHLCPISGPE